MSEPSLFGDYYSKGRDTDSVAERKLNDPNRNKVWTWKCLFNRCRARGRVNFKIPNNQSAIRHSETHIGHNVITIQKHPDGDILGEVFVKNSKPNYQGEAPF